MYKDSFSVVFSLSDALEWKSSGRNQKTLLEKGDCCVYGSGLFDAENIYEAGRRYIGVGLNLHPCRFRSVMDGLQKKKACTAFNGGKTPPKHRITATIEATIRQILQCNYNGCAKSLYQEGIKIGDLIENAYRDGITANMCDALSKLKPENTEDVTVETSVYYAEALTQTVSPPKVFTLDNSHFLFIDEISKRYKDCTLVEDVTLKGTIKMLSKSPSAGGDEEENTVRLLTKIDGQMRSISLHLPPDKHALACNAYRDDKEVCISGTIDKSGKYWFFTEVTEFTVI